MCMSYQTGAPFAYLGASLSSAVIFSSIMLMLIAPCLFAGLASASLRNITVDDTHGDPIFGTNFTYVQPVWNFGPTCSSCEAHPDASQAYMGTWHDTSYLPTGASDTTLSASISFTGTNAYVHRCSSGAYLSLPRQRCSCVLHTSRDPAGGSHLTFQLDGFDVEPYDWEPNNPTGYTYNTLVYANPSTYIHFDKWRKR